MIKSVITLSLLFVFLAAGTANALMHGYYEGIQTISEPASLLLLGTGLIGVGIVSRKTMMK